RAGPPAVPERDDRPQGADHPPRAGPAPQAVGRVRLVHAAVQPVGPGRVRPADGRRHDPEEAGGRGPGPEAACRVVGDGAGRGGVGGRGGAGGRVAGGREAGTAGRTRGDLSASARSLVWGSDTGVSRTSAERMGGAADRMGGAGRPPVTSDSRVRSSRDWPAWCGTPASNRGRGLVVSKSTAEDPRRGKDRKPAIARLDQTTAS